MPLADVLALVARLRTADLGLWADDRALAAGLRADVAVFFICLLVYLVLLKPDYTLTLSIVQSPLWRLIEQ